MADAPENGESERRRDNPRYKPPKPKQAEGAGGYDAALKAVRAISDIEVGPGDAEGYRSEIDATTQDRGAAILLSANLENTLQTAIVRRLRLKGSMRSDMLSLKGPAGTFSGKIILAHAIGLIGPKSRRNLDIVRTVRNAFAHANVSLRFENAEIAGLCSHLNVPEVVQIAGTVLGPPQRPAFMSPHRAAFTQVCEAMTLLLLTTEMQGPTPIDLNGLKDDVRKSIEDVVGSDAELWAWVPPLP